MKMRLQGKKIKQVIMLQFELNVDGIIEAVLTVNLNTDALLKTRSVVRGTNNSGHKFCKWW